MSIVATNGCFDPLTGSHVALLEEASKEADMLVVLLASDAAVRRLRGPGRPLLPYEHRWRVLKALTCVGQVIGYDAEEDLAEAYRQLRPTVLAKGAEWSGASLTGQEHCRRVVLIPEQPGHASDFLDRYAEAVGVVDPGPGVRVVAKAWGEEWVFADQEGYTGKVLHVYPGWQSSLHRHAVKDETFLVLRGDLLLEAQDIGRMVLRTGESFRVRPGTYHRFANGGKHIIRVAESGTRHDDSDVERAEMSRKLDEDLWRGTR